MGNPFSSSWHMPFSSYVEFSPSCSGANGRLPIGLPYLSLHHMHVSVSRRCHFSTFKQCQEWLKRLNRAIARPTKPEDLFAFAYHAWCLGVGADEEDQHAHLCRPGELLGIWHGLWCCALLPALAQLTASLTVIDCWCLCRRPCEVSVRDGTGSDGF